MEVEGDLYSDFGPELGVGDGTAVAPWSDSGVANQLAEGAGSGAAPAAGVLEPPLVTIGPDAADMYADLFDDQGSSGGILLKTQVAELSSRVQRQEAELKGLHQQVETLTQQNGELSERCATLSTNISSLFNTAKLELQRKDAEIRELRERLAATGCARGRPPAPVAPRPGSGAAQTGNPQRWSPGPTDSDREHGSVELPAQQQHQAHELEQQGREGERQRQLPAQEGQDRRDGQRRSSSMEPSQPRRLPARDSCLRPSSADEGAGGNQQGQLSFEGQGNERHVKEHQRNEHHSAGHGLQEGQDSEEARTARHSGHSDQEGRRPTEQQLVHEEQRRHGERHRTERRGDEQRRHEERRDDGPGRGSGRPLPRDVDDGSRREERLERHERHRDSKSGASRSGSGSSSDRHHHARGHRGGGSGASRDRERR